MSASLSGVFSVQEFTDAGLPLVSGRLYTYAYGTTTQKTAYTDAAGTIAHTYTLDGLGGQYIALNARGELPAPLYLASGSYDLSLKRADGSSVWTRRAEGPDIVSVTTATILTSVSGTNTITASLSGLTAYTTGQEFRFIATGTNTGAATLNVNSLGAVAITRNGGAAVVGGDILSGTVIPVVYDGTQFQMVAPTVGRLIGMQVFTASGTYTPTSGTASVIVEVQAPGGGSGGAAAVVAGNFAAGAAGGGGGYGRKRITSAFSGVSVTIGAVGAAGTAGNNAGGTGGTTSFGALISCTGGVGGGGGASLGAPGVASGGTGSGATGGTATGADFSRPGGSGQVSFSVSVSNGIRGAGGESYYGAGGAEGTVITSVTGGAVGSGYGGGAAGPMNINATLSAVAGSAGAPGLVVVWEYA